MIDGLNELTKRLRSLAKRGPRAIGGAALAAGLAALEQSIKSHCPGSIGQEVGARSIRESGSTLRGVVGLGVKGAESHVNRPHGHFLAAGTKHIQPRSFVADGISSGTAAAATDMAAAARAKFQELTAT